MRENLGSYAVEKARKEMKLKYIKSPSRRRREKKRLKIAIVQASLRIGKLKKLF